MSPDDALLEVYGRYVETAEAVSDRRGRTNNFFLAVNSTLVTVDSIALRILEDILAALVMATAGVVLCVAWYRLLRAYQSLNSAKFAVICEIEKAFPASPFTEEWRHLTTSRETGRYAGLSSIETTVPWVFACLYLAIAIGYLLVAFT